MKRTHKTNHSSLTLGDLIVAVSTSARSQRETMAALTDLINSGRVCLSRQRAKVRLV